MRKHKICCEIQSKDHYINQSNFIVHFNFITKVVGTSAGAIITVGLAKDFELSKIDGLFMSMKSDVFKGRPPYQSKTLEDLLEKYIGTDRLIDIAGPKVIITAVTTSSQPELRLLRNFQHPVDHDNENGMIN